MRARVIAAIDAFMARSERREWLAAFSSNQFQLLVDEEYRVSIGQRVAPATAPFLFAMPLGLLGLDHWAMELGGGVKDAALDEVAQTVVRALERPTWWVP
jgi:hypothetical protein